MADEFSTALSIIFPAVRRPLSPLVVKKQKQKTTNLHNKLELRWEMDDKSDSVRPDKNRLPSTTDTDDKKQIKNETLESCDGDNADLTHRKVGVEVNNQGNYTNEIVETDQNLTVKIQDEANAKSIHSSIIKNKIEQRPLTAATSVHETNEIENEQVNVATEGAADMNGDVQTDKLTENKGIADIVNDGTDFSKSLASEKENENTDDVKINFKSEKENIDNVEKNLKSEKENATSTMKGNENKVASRDTRTDLLEGIDKNNIRPELTTLSTPTHINADAYDVENSSDNLKPAISSLPRDESSNHSSSIVKPHLITPEKSLDDVILPANDTHPAIYDVTLPEPTTRPTINDDVHKSKTVDTKGQFNAHAQYEGDIRPCVKKSRTCNIL